MEKTSKTLEEKLAEKQAAFDMAVLNGEKSICSIDSGEDCLSCGS